LRAAAEDPAAAGWRARARVRERASRQTPLGV